MKSGDPCPCGGRLYVANSEPHGAHQVRYLACDRCGNRPPNNKVIVPAEFIRRRGVA
jgi:hypothetical protein